MLSNQEYTAPSIFRFQLARFLRFSESASRAAGISGLGSTKAVRDERMYNDISDMLQSHESNIALVENFQGGSS